MPGRCEVVEVRNLEDAVGYSCSRTASTQCSDCGIELCEPHAEICGACRSIFCLPCFFCHQAQHSKRVSAGHGRDRGRKTASICLFLQFRRIATDIANKLFSLTWSGRSRESFWRSLRCRASAVQRRHQACTWYETRFFPAPLTKPICLSTISIIFSGVAGVSKVTATMLNVMSH